MLLVNEVFQTRKIINANGHKLTAYCMTLVHVWRSYYDP